MPVISKCTKFSSEAAGAGQRAAIAGVVGSVTRSIIGSANAGTGEAAVRAVGTEASSWK